MAQEHEAAIPLTGYSCILRKKGFLLLCFPISSRGKSIKGYAVLTDKKIEQTFR